MEEIKMQTIVQKLLLSTLILFMVACSDGKPKPPSSNSSSSSSTSVGTSSVSSALVSLSSAITTSASSTTVSLSSSSAATATAYNVTITDDHTFKNQVANVPTNNLTAANFAFVIVDLSGKVLEKITPTNDELIKNSIGSWSIQGLGTPRADRLIVIDITKSIVLSVGDNINQTGFIYAPTTDTRIEINVGSTAAYKNFISELGGIGSFTSVNIDPNNLEKIRAIENLVDNVQEIIDSRFNISDDTLEEALAAVKIKVIAIAKQEIQNINKSTTGTVVNLIRDEGGMYVYDASTPSDIGYDAYVGMMEETRYDYNGSAFVLALPDSEDDGLLLNSDGWGMFSKIKTESYNSDGSVTFQSFPVKGHEVTLKTEQVFDLSGRNIKDFVSSEYNTQGLPDLIEPTKTFANGSKAYRSTFSVTNPVYSLTLDKDVDTNGDCDSGNNTGIPITDLGGNCNALVLWNENQTAKTTLTELNETYSEDVQPNSVGFKTVGFFGVYNVQIINDSAKSVRIYSYNNKKQLVLSNKGTWSEITLPYLQENATAIQIQITDIITMNDAQAFLGANLKYLLVKQAGFLRLGFSYGNEIDFGYSGADFNGTANTSIIDALIQPAAGLLSTNVPTTRPILQTIQRQQKRLPKYNF
jgi:hypothetical protein